MNFSDDFAGLSAGAGIGSRTLNNALGGSGSKTWAGSTTGATGGGAVNMGATYMRITDSTQGKARIKFSFSSSTNFAIGLLSANTTDFRSTYAILYRKSTNELLLRQFDGSSSSLGDVDSEAITLSTSTNYYLEGEYDGTTVKGRVFASDGVTQLGADVTVTPGTYPSGGNLVVWEYFGGGFVTADDFTHDASAGAGSGLFPFKIKSVDGGGMQNLGGMSIR